MTTPTGHGGSHRHHLVTVLVENKAGVLARVAGCSRDGATTSSRSRSRRPTTTA